MHSTDLHSTTAITPFPVTMETKEGTSVQVDMGTTTITMAAAVMVIIMVAATTNMVVDPGRSLEDMATNLLMGRNEN